MAKWIDTLLGRTKSDPLTEILKAVQAKMGPLKDETVMSVIGFQMGGPINMIEADKGDYFVTSELSTPEGYVASKEGFRYELGLRAESGAEYAQEALTFLAGHFSQNPLGQGDAISLGTIGKIKALEGRASYIPSSLPNFGCFMIVPTNPAIFRSGAT